VLPVAPCSEYLKEGERVIDEREKGVATQAVAKLCPDVPGGISIASSACGNPSGGNRFDSAQFMLQIVETGRVASFQGGCTGANRCKGARTSTSDKSKEQERKSAIVLVTPEA